MNQHRDRSTRPCHQMACPKAAATIATIPNTPTGRHFGRRIEHHSLSEPKLDGA